MTRDTRHDHSNEPNDSTDQAGPDDGPDIVAEETKLVVEFTVPPEDFVLSETLDRVPGETLEFEQLVPTSEGLLPYLWATDDVMATFEEAAVDDPTVESLHRVATLDEGALYRVTWTDVADHLLTWLKSRDAAVLHAESDHGRWLLKLRVDSRESLGDLQTFCHERDIQFDLVRLFELTEPKMGQYNVSEKQREVMILALEMGYFEVPREATLKDVAQRLDISPKAASERLRRGQTNLLNNTLVIGGPSGVGIGGEA